jgi:hypothetical protein
MRQTKLRTPWLILPAVMAALVAGSAPALSEESTLAPGVYFENDGKLSGWDRNYAQKDGVIRNVSSPKYKGSSAIEAKQVYINETGGYHSEVIKRGAQSVGQDRYYGQAIFVPANWKFHNQNITFQQWSPEDPEGPWLLMFIQGSAIRFGGSGGISGTVGSIAGLRGSWIRVVTRFKLARDTGKFEVWINGTKRVSMTRTVLPKTSRTMRWSSGIYCTAWRNGKPSGQSTVSIFHDHHRIASTYVLAEPANW